MEIPFWDKSIETIDRSELEKLQLAGLKQQVENALKTSFYKDKLLKEGIIGGSSIRTLDDIRKLPFTQIGQKYNISDNAVRKWCIAYNLPKTKKEINSYSDAEWRKI